MLENMNGQQNARAYSLYNNSANRATGLRPGPASGGYPYYETQPASKRAISSGAGSKSAKIVSFLKNQQRI